MVDVDSLSRILANRLPDMERLEDELGRDAAD